MICRSVKYLIVDFMKRRSERYLSDIAVNPAVATPVITAVKPNHTPPWICCRAKIELWEELMQINI
jgi:hypothetical protein